MNVLAKLLGRLAGARKGGLVSDLPKLWAMERSRLEALCARLSGIEGSGELAAAAAARAKTGWEPVGDEVYEYSVEDGVAVFPIAGVIQKQVPWLYRYFGINATSTQAVQAALAQAIEDRKVDSILLEIDSPGGSVDGVQELADAIRTARAVKPVSAHISDLGASAAYWLASQAGRVTANQTAEVGSIGVYTVMVDSSGFYGEAGLKVHLIASGEHKGAGVPGVPITEEQLAVEQEIVNKLAAEFVGAIAAGRGRSPEDIAQLATGRTWLAPDAQAAGLIDGIANYETALVASRPASSKEGARGMTGQNSGTAAASPAPGANQASPAKAGASVDVDAAKRLEDLEAAFPADGAFARDAWKRGLSPDQARQEHYPRAVQASADAEARAKAAEGKLSEAEAKHKGEIEAKNKEIAELKELVAKAGHQKLPQDPPAAGGGDAIKTYQAKREELLKAGDKRPESTIAEKFPAIQAAYLAAVNAGHAPPAAAAAASGAAAGAAE